MIKTMEVNIEQFNIWAAERVAVLETCYESLKVPLDYRLNRKEPVHKNIFTNCFKSAYSLINEEIEDAKWRAEEADIPEKVLETAVKAFKDLKANVRREKAEYRKAIEELHETIDTHCRQEKNMDRTLENRERRLRYKAEQKGLRVRKDSYRIDNQKFSGYLIMKQSGMVIADCYRYWKGLAPIDDAEAIISEY